MAAAALVSTSRGSAQRGGGDCCCCSAAVVVGVARVILILSFCFGGKKEEFPLVHLLQDVIHGRGYVFRVRNPRKFTTTFTSSDSLPEKDGMAYPEGIILFKKLTFDVHSMQKFKVRFLVWTQCNVSNNHIYLFLVTVHHPLIKAK